MGRHGVETPPGISNLVIELGRGSPAMTNSRIAQKIEDTFGLIGRIDQSTVSRIFARVGIPTSAKERVAASSAPSADDREPSGVWTDHSRRLLSSMTQIRRPETLDLADRNLIVWTSRFDTEPTWAVSGGVATYRDDGSVYVRLAIDDSTQTGNLRQHLPDDPVWLAVDEWREALGAELAARIALFREIVAQIERPAATGGLASFTVGDVPRDGLDRAVVSQYYAFTILHQILARALRQRLGPKREEEFLEETTNTLHLGGDPVITAPDSRKRRRAVKFLLDAQAACIGKPQTVTAAAAYRRATEAGSELAARAQQLEDIPALPEASRCGQCRIWLGESDITRT